MTWDKKTGCIYVTGDVIYRKDVFPALDPLLSPNITQELTFPSFGDFEPLNLFPTPESRSQGSPVELSPASHDKTPASPIQSLPFVPFFPKVLIPLSASIHAPLHVGEQSFVSPVVDLTINAVQQPQYRGTQRNDSESDPDNSSAFIPSMHLSPSST